MEEMDTCSLIPRKRKPLKQLVITNGVSANKKQKIDLQRRAGTINHMILKNFMCHSLLEVDLTSNNVNIIFGQNGSGKSAILTALVVGLAGKATLTNRGNSIKSFVKSGRNSASIEIELHNDGPMAFRPSVFGRKITIIRNIASSGSSTYRIKDENGKVFSTLAKEVLNITANLNIQIDNPVCILNQDTSRCFLNSNDPKQKFKLFMKATKLDALAEEYDISNKNKQNGIRILQEKKEIFKGLQDELKKMKIKIENQKSIITLRERLNCIEVELCWAKVRDKEDDMKNAKGKVNQIQKKYDNLLHTTENRSEIVNNIRKTISDLQREISELKDTIKVQSRPQMEMKRTIDELRHKYNRKKEEKNLLKISVDSKTKDANVLRQEIANSNDAMTRVEQEKIQRLRNLTKMEEKIKGMEDHLQTCRNDLYQIQSDVGRKEEEQGNFRRDIQQIDNKIANDRNSLNALKNESGNSLLLYGTDIPKVKQKIAQNKHRFTQEPRGPLGSYIKLKDKKWAVAVEGFLGPQLLGAFIVDNKKDNQLLVDIFNQVWTSGRKPMIITSKFFNQKHNVRQNLVQAPSDCFSLYNVLDINDVVVSNCIVDQAAIEGILLIPNDNRAMELLSNQRNVPLNCQQGVTMKGDKYYPDPNYKSYGSRYHRAQYLQVDTKAHMLQLEQNIQEFVKEKQTLTNQYEAIRNEVREQSGKKDELEEKIRKLMTARTQIRRQLDELKSSAEPEVANVQLLESELLEINKILQEHNSSMARINEELKEIKEKLIESEEKLNQLKESNNDLEDRVLPIEAQINEHKIREKEIISSDEFDKRQLKENENKLIEAKRQMDLVDDELKRRQEQAGNLGERPLELRQVPVVAAEINSLTNSIEKCQLNNGDPEILLKKYKELSQKFKNNVEIINNLNDNVRELTEATEKRRRYYKLTESYFITYIKHSFKKVMEYRQFKGSLNVNVQDNELELVVIPQQGSQGLTSSSNLSGGERSFSTVAFLYSLWQCMDFPFYFLDEFDVFMDKLNRTKVIEILLHHAKTRPTLQFVFLTPQDVSFINKDVSILRLQDPERLNV